MKKVFALLLAMIMLFALVACSENRENTNDTNIPTNTESGTTGTDETPTNNDGVDENTSSIEGTQSSEGAETTEKPTDSNKPTENTKPTETAKPQDTQKPTETTKPNNPNGISDNNPPKLESFKFVENGQEFGVGDTVHVQMKVTDDSKVDINRTYPVVSNGDHYIWFDMTYNSATGYLEGSYTFKETDVIGKYSLSYIPCYDIYGNYYHGTISGNHYITLKSGGISDNNPPKLESFKFVENGQEFGVGDTVHVQMKVTDDSKVDINRTYPVVSNGDHYIWFDMTYNSATGYLEGSYTFKETDVIGKYSLSYIPCYDIYGNYYHGTISGNHYIIFG